MYNDDAFATMLLTIPLSADRAEYARPLSTAEYRRLLSRVKSSAAGRLGALLRADISGLMKAVSSFRPEAGKLTTYASRCIENEILMQLRAGRKTRGTVQLDDPIGMDKEGNEVRLTDLLGTDKNEVSDAAETAIESARALRLLQTPLLDARERRVVEMRYGLRGGAPLPQREVAKALGLSRSYISRIEKKALEKLRKALGG